MRDEELLHELLEAESEAEVLTALDKRKLLETPDRWAYLGLMPNNQAIVHAQQSTVAAALVEKYTNGCDAILLRHCKARGIDPRGAEAHELLPTMMHAVESRFGDLSEADDDVIRRTATEQLVLYATGSKERPCLSLYDAGEGQLAKDFPETFCSLIHANATGSYKGAVPFVQGRFNMGGTGVLPFCSEKKKLQLVVSRVPPEIAGGDDHEWAYTLMCFFPGKDNAAWKYLLGPDLKILTAGSAPRALLPDARAPKPKEALNPRERKVTCGTLIKMYDFKAPKSNICGELYKQLKQFLLRPPLPLRLYECRPSYAANIMANTIWDVMSKWKNDGSLEPDFEDGADIVITLSSGEQVPAEVRVFKATKTNKKGEEKEVEALTGVRALINGQSHAKRGEEFFKGKAVDKEHIAGSLLVTLDCTALGQDSKNALFMSNRETFRNDDPLLKELLEALKGELRSHEALIELNNRRYEERVKNAVENEDGLNALEELLTTDPELALLFGSATGGRVAGRTAANGQGGSIPGTPEPFKGNDFPTFFQRADGSTSIDIEIPQGDSARASFKTDVKNNYFTRKRPPRGRVTFAGDLKPEPSYRLFNGRLTFTCVAEKDAPVGAQSSATVTIQDRQSAKPFVLTINAVVVLARQPKPAPDPDAEPKEPKEPRVETGPSRPAVLEDDLGPDHPPVEINRDPKTGRLVIVINTSSPLREQARNMRPESEQHAVDFVYKYGLALATMGLLDYERQTDAWKDNDADCRRRIAEQMTGLARVIVPLCLSLPKNLPKK